jgi:hypothetical protein
VRIGGRKACGPPHNLIIDHPARIDGHGSAWFPVFHDACAAGIMRFLESPIPGGPLPAAADSGDP